MVIRELLKKADKLLSDKGIEDSFNESAILFAYAADKTKTYIFTHMDETVSQDTKILFDDFIAKRSKRMPVAYIVGKAWFMSLELFVDKTTLVPRPETEELVEEVLNIIKNIHEEKVYMLDLCTGSGCIGLAVAHYEKKVSAILSDLNPDCVNMARRNVLKHDLGNRVAVVESDLYNSIEDKEFDLVSANPPYIPSDDLRGLEDDVRLYEPSAALDGGLDGLDFYRKIINGAHKHLKSGGYLVLEAGIDQSEAISLLLSDKYFANISIKKDIAGIPRIICAQKP